MGIDLISTIQLITAFGLLLTGISSAFNVLISWRNGERAKKIVGEIEVIKTQTDGINSKLVRVTGEAEHAKGVIQGAQAEHDNPR